MHAEEDIKNQIVDSYQPKDWHAADSLRNSSYAHTCRVTLPLLGLQPAAVTSSWVPCSPLTPIPSSQYELPGTHHLPGLARSLSCHHNHWWGAASLLTSCTATDLLLLADPDMGLCSSSHGCLWLRVE